MKKTNTLYWIFTALFGGFMLFTSIPDIIQQEEAVKFITNLGYPDYFVPFIGIAKVLGVLAILMPGNYPRVKEWAYAGLFFDLIGAFYSVVAKEGFQPQMAFFVPIVGLGVLSYIYYHKRLKGL